MSQQKQTNATLDSDQDSNQIELNNGQLRVVILPLGASIQSIHLSGYEHSLVLGSASLDRYLDQAKYFGAVVGRVANRTAQGRALIDNQQYTLPLSPPEKHHLHGGPLGTSYKNWSVVEHNDAQVHLQSVLADGEMGYPGKMVADVFYRLHGTALELEILATTDQLTICNFAGHSYFNLDGQGSVLDHKLAIQAEHYLPVTEELIPTGEVQAVQDSPFDFRTLRRIARDDYPGLDTNFCLAQDKQPVRDVATLIGPLTGIQMSLKTNETGLQIYDGRHIQLAQEHNINHGPLSAYSGLAMEAQAWPDAINHTHFPSILLSPKDRYQQITRYCFS